MLDYHLAEGREEVYTPFMVKEECMYGSAQFPKFRDVVYYDEEAGLYMLPTAEVSITNMYSGEILEEADLPLRYIGHTPCFRREKMSAGRDVRGIKRGHQFDKVEIVQLQHPSRSYEALEEMVNHVEKLVISLGLPYRIVQLCGGDLSFTSALTYDFEVYAAGQDKWLEVSSVSNFESFQANRMKLRFKESGEKKTQLVHTLNGSALALPRIVAAILENNQSDKGIVIPKVLRKYTGFDIID